MSTSERVLDSALASFGGRGYDATSLDAIARDLGIRKQSILYHFPSKEQLLDAVVDKAVAELSQNLEQAVLAADQGWARVEAVVRSVFRLANQRPELLGLLREVSRIGPPTLTRATESLDPLMKRAVDWLDVEMTAGRVRKSDPRLLVMSVYATVSGAGTEVEVLRAVGIEPSLRSAALRRRELLNFLKSALQPPS